MQLNQFNGGVNTRLSPHAIGINEGVEYINIDNSLISLKPIKDDKDENTKVNKYIYNYKGNWIGSQTYRNYQEFQGVLYYSDGINIPQRTTDNVTWSSVGIASPYDTLGGGSTITTGELDGTYTYCYTFYNSITGVESKPSDYIGPYTLQNQGMRILFLIPQDLKDPQVNMFRLYRMGGNLKVMSLVAEVSSTNNSYDDILSDTNIIGTVLSSYNNGQAPSKLTYLTEANAMIFGALDDKLRYSQIAYVDYWSEFNYIDFDDTITGIGAVGNGLLVFTKFKTYIVTGTSPDTLSKYLLSSNQGCLSHDTICYIKNTLIWLSSDGICVSSGGDIVVVSRDKLGKLKLNNIKDSVVYDDVYYIAYDTNSVLCFDTRFGNVLKHITCSVDRFHVYNDILYYSNNGKLYSMFQSSSYRELKYKSAEFGDGQISNLKSYKSVYVSVIGSMVIKVFINSVLVGTYTADHTTSELKIPQDKRRGYTIQFEVIGDGELRELQYNIEGRKNGK